MYFGLWTVAELEALLTNKDAEFAALEKAWRAFDGQWMGFDPKADSQWMSEFNALKTRYGAARDAANKKIAVAAAGGDHLDSIPADAEYKAVLLALQRTHGVTGPGDFQDLWNRLQSAMQAQALATGQKPPVIFDPVMVQEKQGADADSRFLGGSVIGDTERLVDAAMRSAGLTPRRELVADDPSEPGKSHTGTWIAVGAGLAVAGFVGLKVGWKAVKPW